MQVWEWVVVDSLVLLVVFIVLLPLTFVARRRWLTRAGGVFELSINDRGGTHPQGWTIGLGRYVDNKLEWFRFFSLRLRPTRSFAREALDVLERRLPHGPEAFALHSGHVIIECRDGARPVQLAMGEQSVTALLAWLESSPPGSSSHRVV
ncbi:MAG: DUF2550 domain-containing protein [Actinomycetota bacterium]|nr:DUF2550 domain-containing protein [Actinomycetota bacterium]